MRGFQDSPQKSDDGTEPVLNEMEQELMDKMQSMGDDIVDSAGLGMITAESMPHAFFNVLCYMIAYKTGTSLKHIMEMCLFDFVSYMYIVSEINKKEQSDGDSSPSSNTPETRDMQRTMGG